METIHCKSWEDFMIRVARNLGAGRVAFGRIYRGQSDPSWPVASKFERWLHLKRGKDSQRPIASMFGPSGPEAYEERYLDSFREAAVGTPGLSTDGLKPDDWWVLGRHHGLVTRLLDWTHSPYIAAFFAFADLATRSVPGFGEGLSDWIPKLESGDVAVWALAPLRCLFDAGEFEYIDTHRDQFYRQRAQMGVFTRLRHDVHLDLASYLEARGEGHYLECIRIPRTEMGKALHDLRLMNIRYATLFPDLDGAAREANLNPEISGLPQYFRDEDFQAACAKGVLGD